MVALNNQYKRVEWPAETEADCSTLTLEQSFAVWRDLMDTGESIVLATLREEIGPDADLDKAYGRWYEQRMPERDRELYGIDLPDSKAPCKNNCTNRA
jgi:hypothetical protein